MSRLLLALGLLSSAVTADYTTTLLLVGFDSQSVVGSVIATVCFLVPRISIRMACD